MLWPTDYVILSEEEAVFAGAISLPMGTSEGIYQTEPTALWHVFYKILKYGNSPLYLSDVVACDPHGNPIIPSTENDDPETSRFNNAIQADFIYTPEEPLLGDEITFDGSPSISNCGDIISYSWDFGDGNTASGIITIHSYKSAGSYTVTLTVTDEAGYSDTTSKIVTVVESKLEADFTYIPEDPIVSEEITFDGSLSTSDIEIVSYRWDFGDGTIGEGIIATHSYQSVGSYTVTLTITDEAGHSDDISKTINVLEIPDVKVDLVRRAAWPEHHHFDISSDEDGFQTLFGKVQNMGSEPCYIKVRFKINGEILETDPIWLEPRKITGTKKSNVEDLQLLWNNYTPGTKYTVYVQAFGSVDLRNWFGGKKIKKFSFTVVK
jgi:PKD repeat protein